MQQCVDGIKFISDKIKFKFEYFAFELFEFILHLHSFSLVENKRTIFTLSRSLSLH